MLHNNLPNMVLQIPADPDSDPFFHIILCRIHLNHVTKIIKRRQCTKKNKNKLRSKTHFSNPIKKCAKLTDKMLIAAYKSRLIIIKLDQNPLQQRVYFLSFVTSLKNIYQNIRKHTCYLCAIHLQERKIYQIVLKHPHITFFVHIQMDIENIY